MLQTTQKTIDINCDLGESFGNYTIGNDKDVIPYITSANIACGYHASDPTVMRETVGMCLENNVRIGAHPGLPDLMGFGRRTMNISPEDAYDYILYQLGALYAFAHAAGTSVSHIKPHGALYNMAAKDYRLAYSIAKAVHDFDSDLIIMSLSGSMSIKAAQDAGVKYASEVFADRAYLSDGSLVPRSRPDAMISDENLAVERVIRMVKEHRVTTADGEDIEIIPDSVCVHGDNARAVEFAKKIRLRLEENGITVSPLNK